MDFLHNQFFLKKGDTVVLDCDTQCNFFLMNDANFLAYQSNRTHECLGGWFTMFPAAIVVPYAGNWHAVIDLDGASANICYSFSVV